MTGAGRVRPEAEQAAAAGARAVTAGGPPPGEGATLPEELRPLVRAVRSPAAADPAAVRRHLHSLTKPPGSLGRLEELALRLGLIYGDPPPRLHRRTVFVLAADHGVAARGVSAYPQAVTAQMCANFCRGGAAINAIAGTVEARVVVADFGVKGEMGHLPGLRTRKVRSGTRDLARESALDPEEAAAAVLAGARLFDEKAAVTQVAALGEMGIGNTTSAAVVAAALTGDSAEAVVGPGTGVGAEGRRRKVAAVRSALERLPPAPDPLRVLSEAGGLEIAGLVGVTLACARAGRAVVTDGFIATAAAALAVRLCPAAAGYLFASHLSPEPGHRVFLEELGLRPLFDLEMRLGEGTGAVLAFPILDAAGAVLREMATFEEAGVAGEAREAEEAGVAGTLPRGSGS